MPRPHERLRHLAVALAWGVTLVSAPTALGADSFMLTSWQTLNYSDPALPPIREPQYFEQLYHDGDGTSRFRFEPANIQGTECLFYTFYEDKPLYPKNELYLGVCPPKGERFQVGGYVNVWSRYIGYGPTPKFATFDVMRPDGYFHCTSGLHVYMRVLDVAYDGAGRIERLALDGNHACRSNRIVDAGLSSHWELGLAFRIRHNTDVPHTPPAPFAVLDADSLLWEGETVTLDLRKSWPGTSPITSVEWTQVGGPSGVRFGAMGMRTDATLPTGIALGGEDIVLRAKVTNAEGHSDTREFTVRELSKSDPLTWFWLYHEKGAYVGIDLDWDGGGSADQHVYTRLLRSDRGLFNATFVKDSLDDEKVGIILDANATGGTEGADTYRTATYAAPGLAAVGFNTNPWDGGTGPVAALSAYNRGCGELYAEGVVAAVTVGPMKKDWGETQWNTREGSVYIDAVQACLEIWRGDEFDGYTYWTFANNVLHPSVPQVAAGADRLVQTGDQVLLQDDGTADAQQLVGWQWRQVRGTPVTLTGEGAGAVSFVAPDPVGTSEELEFELRVTDADGYVGKDAILVKVQDAAAPVAVADAVTVDFNTSTRVALTINDTDLNGDLAPGTLRIVGAPALGTATVDKGGTITYLAPATLAATTTVTVSYDVADARGHRSAPGTLSVTVLAHDLAIAIQDQSTANIGGGPLRYRIQVTNGSNRATPGATVSGPAPAGLSSVFGSFGSNYFQLANGTLSATVPHMSPGQSWVAYLDATATIAGPFPLDLRVTSTNPDSNPANDRVVAARTIKGDLSATLTGPSKKRHKGEKVGFTATVRNAGGVSLVGAQLVAPVPAGSSFVAGAFGTARCTVANATIRCPLPTLAANAQVSGALTLKATKVGTLTFVVRAVSELDGNAGNDPATVAVRIYK